MKKALFLLLGLFFISPSTYAWMCDDFAWAYLVSPDGTFLGYLDANVLASDAIANNLWDYGSNLSSKSIFNNLWKYWSTLQNTSPWNTLATKPPLIKKWNTTMGSLSLNRFADGAQNTFDILYCFIPASDTRLKPYWWLNPWWHATTYVLPWNSYYSSSTPTLPVLTDEELCQLDFWSNATAWDPWKCKCKNGYIWNKDMTSCIPLTEEEKCMLEFWMNATNSDQIWYCKCRAWYVRSSDGKSCVANTSNYSNSYTTTTTTTISVNCNTYWPNAEAINGSCVCKTNYEWNNNRNWCVADRNHPLYNWTDFRSAKDGWDYINMLLDFEDTVSNSNSSNSWIPENVQNAKQALWNKAAIFDSLVPLFKAKDSKTQENVKALLKTFESSKDEYTRNIWIYFWYLVK